MPWLDRFLAPKTLQLLYADPEVAFPFAVDEVRRLGAEVIHTGVDSFTGHGSIRVRVRNVRTFVEGLGRTFYRGYLVKVHRATPAVVPTILKEAVR